MPFYVGYVVWIKCIRAHHHYFISCMPYNSGCTLLSLLSRDIKNWTTQDTNNTSVSLYSNSDKLSTAGPTNLPLFPRIKQSPHTLLFVPWQCSCNHPNTPERLHQQDRDTHPHTHFGELCIAIDDRESRPTHTRANIIISRTTILCPRVELHTDWTSQYWLEKVWGWTLLGCCHLCTKQNHDTQV
jgi:hypothetical protein